MLRMAKLTAAGREALRQVEARHAAWANRLDRAILRTTVAVLRKVRRVLDADATPPGPRTQSQHATDTAITLERPER